MHRSGFVNIIGRPNVGKSTLMNALVGERMSIITSKPQTTRHRIIGILSGDDFQIVFSDTPGMIKKPAYKMQEVMNRFAHSALEDADVLVFVTDVLENYEDNDPVIAELKSVEAPKFLVVNKSDLAPPEKTELLIKTWNDRVNFTESLAISAFYHANTNVLLEKILAYLPEGEAFYPKDQLTDKPERFFVAEIIREKILELYHQEIPYSTEVSVESFKETETNAGDPLVRISAYIFVNRETQKMIVLGKNGSAIKKLGTESRKTLEQWLEKKVFLDLHVKVRKDWRDDEQLLRKFGYEL